MAFDAFFLSAVLEEVRTRCIGARVEKIHQPARDTVVVHLRCQEGRQKLWYVEERKQLWQMYCLISMSYRNVLSATTLITKASLKSTNCLSSTNVPVSCIGRGIAVRT